MRILLKLGLVMMLAAVGLTACGSSTESTPVPPTTAPTTNNQAADDADAVAPDTPEQAMRPQFINTFADW